MSMPEDSVIESQLRECVSDALPPEVEVRLRPAGRIPLKAQRAGNRRCDPCPPAATDREVEARPDLCGCWAPRRGARALVVATC